MAGQSELAPAVLGRKMRLHHHPGQLQVFDCLPGRALPIVFTGHGSDTSLFRNNLIERGGLTNATQAITGPGRFKLTDNHMVGFDEKEAAAKPVC